MSIAKLPLFAEREHQVALRVPLHEYLLRRFAEGQQESMMGRYANFWIAATGKPVVCEAMVRKSMVCETMVRETMVCLWPFSRRRLESMVRPHPISTGADLQNCFLLHEPLLAGQALA